MQLMKSNIQKMVVATPDWIMFVAILSKQICVKKCWTKKTPHVKMVKSLHFSWSLLRFPSSSFLNEICIHVYKTSYMIAIHTIKKAKYHALSISKSECFLYTQIWSNYISFFIRGLPQDNHTNILCCSQDFPNLAIAQPEWLPSFS